KGLEHIDQLFKETLQNATIPAPSGAWQAIASKSAVGSSAAVGSAVIVKGTVAAVLVVVSSLLIYTVTKDKPLELKAKSIQSVQKAQAIDLIQEEKLVEINENEESNAIFQGAPTVESKAEVQKPNQKGETQMAPTESIQFGVNKHANLDVFVTAESSKETIEVKVLEEKPVLKDVESMRKPQIEKELRLFPNYFSPNIDGSNDSFYIDMDEPVMYQMTITRLTGDLLFVSTDPKKKWNGMYNGRMLPNGSYIVSLVYQFYNNSKVETKSKLVKLERSK
ncbi:MAG: gliding motility-associated C-terminal domain-containing protein, partial [Bacteroidia bacterium]|nr:gliding motility-associated C-terminal domain-containing protein [Bacteroidia bacterium]